MQGTGQKIKVSYDVNKGRFLIACPFHLTSLVRGLPNRRWDNRNKYWSAPAIRANVEYINERFLDSLCSFSEEAKEAIAMALARYVESRKTASVKTPRFPSWYPFKTAPRSKQEEALNKVYGNKAIALFMDMRVGKTKVVIDLISAMRMEGKAERVLVVCPLSIRRNWIREIGIHAPFPVDTYLLDTAKPKKFDEWLGVKSDFKWMFVGVESLGAGSAVKYCERFLLSSALTVMVVDESSKIKTHNATRSTNCVKLARMAETRIAMTGTPGSPIDLFMQFEFLDPDIVGMGDFYSFRNRYAVMGGYEGKKVVGYDNLEELMETIEPFVFQVRKEEVFPDAPDKVYIRREVVLSKEQRRLYTQVMDEMKIKSDEGDKSLAINSALDKMLRLQEITGGMVSYSIPEKDRQPKGPKFFRETIEGRNPKVQEVLSCAEEYDGPTIVWCAYKDEIEVVASGLRAVYGDDQVVELHGDISEEDRDRNVNTLFQGRKSRFLVANAATGGMGLTMSAAEVEVYYSNTFSYFDRKQSEERAFGPDKKRGTVIVDIVTEDTVDEHIVKALSMKEDVAEYVRNTIDTLKHKLMGNSRG